MLFAQLSLDLEGEQHLFEFSKKTHLGITRNVLDELHGDGGSAGAYVSSVADKLPGCVNQGNQVDTTVFEESLVFGIQDGFLE